MNKKKKNKKKNYLQLLNDYLPSDYQQVIKEKTGFSTDYIYQVAKGIRYNKDIVKALVVTASEEKKDREKIEAELRLLQK